MKNTEWQRRAKAAGLTQRTLAKLFGKRPSTVSDQLQGKFGDVAQEYKAAIIAWELMTEEQRQEWIERLGARSKRR